MPADRAWFQRFEAATPERQREMLANRQQEESARLLSKYGKRGAVTPPAPPEPDPEVAAWLDRVRGPEPTDLDALD